jgi:hypothetical protein
MEAADSSVMLEHIYQSTRYQKQKIIILLSLLCLIIGKCGLSYMTNTVIKYFYNHVEDKSSSGLWNILEQIA